MINELIKLMRVQEQELKHLLVLLEAQYKMIMDKDVFGLEGVVDKIGECSKEIAKEEVKRRNILGNKSITEMARTSENRELKEAYKSIQDTLRNVVLKKETNEILIKQNLAFTNKMLALMNPNRDIKTYNSYGNLSK